MVEIKLFELFVFSGWCVLDTYPFFRMCVCVLSIRYVHNGLLNGDGQRKKNNKQTNTREKETYDTIQLILLIGIRVTQMFCLINAESDIYYIDLIYILLDPLNIVSSSTIQRI